MSQIPLRNLRYGVGFAACLLLSCGPLTGEAHAQSLLSSLSAVPQMTLGGMKAAPPVAEALPAAVAGKRFCESVPAPVVTLDTRSKYDQSGAKDTANLFAKRQRELHLKPVRTFLRTIGGQAFSGNPHLEDCAAASLDEWAQAGALSDMRSDDANLSRSRFMSEISLSVDYLDRNGRFTSAQRERVNAWLADVARSTVRYFRFHAGPKSRRNNHRYWAALAVGAAGYLNDDRHLVEWAHDSAGIGLCQVDSEGALALEIQRGSQARNYHVYALRPLGTLAVMSAARGDDLHSRCGGALARLAKFTLAAVENPERIAEMAGAPQARLVRESDFVAPLRLSVGTSLFTSLQAMIERDVDTAEAAVTIASSTNEG